MKNAAPRPGQVALPRIRLQPGGLDAGRPWHIIGKIENGLAAVRLENGRQYRDRARRASWRAFRGIKLLL
jgi:hypothetical protein